MGIQGKLVRELSRAVIGSVAKQSPVLDKTAHGCLNNIANISTSLGFQPGLLFFVNLVS